MNYALIIDGIVENVFVCCDAETAQALFPDDVVVAADGAGIGWSYVDGQFVAPPAPEISHDELVAQAVAQKNAGMNSATNEISVLQDAADLDMATDEEMAQLAAWKKYRVLMSRVDPSKAPDIDWPEPPTQ